MKDTECPYCNTEINICHDDGYGYEEGVIHQQECSKCGKTFVYDTSISFHYSTSKADCLNGQSHDYKPNKTYPIEFTKMACSMCDDRRDPSKEEMEQILKSSI